MKKLDDQVRVFVDACRRQEVAVLPGTRELGVKFGVSYTTIINVLNRLAAEGVVEMHNRRRCRVVGVHEPPRAGSEGLGGWTGVKGRIEKDIINGVLGTDGILPMAKELLSRYGASKPTMRKALSALVHERAIERIGRRYRIIPRVSLVRHRGTVLLVSKELPEHPAWSLVDTPIHSEVARHLELACRRAGCRYLAAVYDGSRDGDMRLRAENGEIITPPAEKSSGREIPADLPGGILGMVVFPVGDEEWMRRFSRIIRRFDRPVAIFHSDTVSIGRLTDLPDSRDFVVESSERAGRTAGEYLHSLGHTRVAYVSFRGPSDWTKRRCEGVAAAFKAAGGPDLVTPFINPDQADIAWNMEEFGWSWDRIRAFLADNPQNQFDRTSKNSVTVQMLRWRAIQREMLEARGGLVLEQALAVPGVTALVAENDLAGIAALDYLESRGIDVPGRMSVVGFDDSFEAFRRGLTSYNFSLDAFAQAMLSYLLQPRRGGRADRNPRTVIEGLLTERNTSAKAPRLKQ